MRKKVAFDYEGAADEETETPGRYVVSPWRMEFRGGVYYLVGYDEEKGETTCFRIDRIGSSKLLNAPAKDPHMVKGASRWQYDPGKFLDQYLSTRND